MKKRTVRLIACLCLVALLLVGCSKQETGPGQMGSKVWEEMPKLTYGVLESDPLEVLSWDSGRCEATSRNALAETENGYYFICHSYLYYAEKSDLNNWILVCNRPDCEHWNGLAGCNAYLEASRFVIKDNRIYFEGYAPNYAHLSPYEGSGYILLNMAGDGTDKQLAYAKQEFFSNTKGKVSNILSSRNWLYYHQFLDKDGKTVRLLYLTSNEGTREIPLNPDYEGDAFIAGFVNGDEAFTCPALGAGSESFFRFVDGELVETNYAGLNIQNGAYVSGNIIRTFRPSDGYYDINLITREETFITPAQLENSYASIVLPNCIIESTLFDSYGWTEEESHQMDLFDGEKWRTVKLPKELEKSGDAYTLSFYDFTVAADSIFFYCRESTNYSKIHLFRIPLSSGELEAEYCCDIERPTEENTKTAQ